MGVAIEEYYVEAVAEFGSNTTAYTTDYLVTVRDQSATICFVPIQTSIGNTISPPFVNSVQVLPIVRDRPVSYVLIRWSLHIVPSLPHFILHRTGERDVWLGLQWRSAVQLVPY